MSGWHAVSLDVPAPDGRCMTGIALRPAPGPQTITLRGQ